MSTDAVVELYNSIQSPGVPPFDSTSLILIAGEALTVMVCWPVPVPAVAMIWAVPGATPVTTPAVLTVAMVVADVDQVTVPTAMSAPRWSLPAAVAVAVCPGTIGVDWERDRDRREDRRGGGGVLVLSEQDAAATAARIESARPRHEYEKFGI